MRGLQIDDLEFVVVEDEFDAEDQSEECSEEVCYVVCAVHHSEDSYCFLCFHESEDYSYEVEYSQVEGSVISYFEYAANRVNE